MIRMSNCNDMNLMKILEFWWNSSNTDSDLGRGDIFW